MKYENDKAKEHWTAWPGGQIPYISNPEGTPQPDMGDCYCWPAGKLTGYNSDVAPMAWDGPGVTRAFNQPIKNRNSNPAPAEGL